MLGDGEALGMKDINRGEALQDWAVFSTSNGSGYASSLSTRVLREIEVISLLRCLRSTYLSLSPSRSSYLSLSISLTHIERQSC